MKTASAVKTWEKTRLQGLVRHKSGGYYARVFLNGKEIWKSLKTKSFSVAEAKFSGVKHEHKKQKALTAVSTDARMTFATVANQYLALLKAKVSIKPKTKKFWGDRLAAVFKSWPEINGKQVRHITPADCRIWAEKFAATSEPSTYNNTVSILRQVFGHAIGLGIIHQNPAAGLERMAIRPKKLELPSLSQFKAFIAEMRAAHSRDSKNAADLAEGLAYTGCRIGESGFIEWQDIKTHAGILRICGDAEDGTKNGEIRHVPLIPESEALFERMRAERADEPPTGKVFLVHECQKSMDRAAKKVGMTRITHHDLRHFFATISIESGVDICTLSRWLGHKDGGALAMKTYAHLRDEHSLAAAKKVSFAA